LSVVEQLQWSFDLPAAVWDRHLAEMHGHPLQSALWGEARHAVDGIEDNRWAVFSHGLPVLMARFEVRPISVLGRVAWMPRGPTVVAEESATVAYGQFLDRLRRAGYLVCVDDAYREVCKAPTPGVSLLPKPQTVWIDLTKVRDKLWSALDSQWRYGVRSAGRAGVVVEQSRDSADVSKFFGLCEQISKEKKFALPGSESLLAALCAAQPSADVEARLFVARLAGELVAGAMVLRCGRTLHYFWGAVDRRFAKQRPGEAVHWGVIEWGMENGLETYDLEGIDPETNPGTYQFKMKMGGQRVSLPGKRAYPLGIAGRVVFKAGKWLGRI
jgi:hypothetical protein